MSPDDFERAPKQIHPETEIPLAELQRPSQETLSRLVDTVAEKVDHSFDMGGTYFGELYDPALPESEQAKKGMEIGAVHETPVDAEIDAKSIVADYEFFGDEGDVLIDLYVVHQTPDGLQIDKHSAHENLQKRFGKLEDEQEEVLDFDNDPDGALDATIDFLDDAVDNYAQAAEDLGYTEDQDQAIDDMITGKRIITDEYGMNFVSEAKAIELLERISRSQPPAQTDLN